MHVCQKREKKLCDVIHRHDQRMDSIEFDFYILTRNRVAYTNTKYSNFYCLHQITVNKICALSARGNCVSVKTIINGYGVLELQIPEKDNKNFDIH